jgi:hypothetical protein
MGRGKCEDVTSDKLQACLQTYVTKPGWIEYSEDMKAIKIHPAKILKSKEMWRELRELLGDRIVLKDSDVRKALVAIHGEKADDQSWSKLKQSAVNDWARVCSLRLRCQARAIAQATSKNPEVRWLKDLWGPEGEPGDMHEGEEEEDKEDDEEEAPEDDQEEAPEDDQSEVSVLANSLAAKASVVMKKPSATSLDTAMPSDVEWFYGYCPKRKEAFRCPTNDVENKAKWEFSDVFEVPLEPSSIHIML